MTGVQTCALPISYSIPGLAGGFPTGVANCTGKINTTDCMVAARAAAVPSGGAAGQGYQPPGSCTPDSYFPTWLKGVIYLKVVGSTITMESGLITKPCGL